MAEHVQIVLVDGHPPGKTNGCSRWGEQVPLLSRLPLKPTQLNISSTFTAGVQANVNPWGATWALEDVEAMAAVIPTQTTRELLEMREWSDTNEAPINMPNPPFLQIKWSRDPISYRGVHINGEPLLIFQKGGVPRSQHRGPILAHQFYPGM